MTDLTVIMRMRSTRLRWIDRIRTRQAHLLLRLAGPVPAGVIAIMCAMSNMNGVIAAAVRRRKSGGLIDAVKGADMSGDRQARLNAAMARYETARRDGRGIDAEMADAEIENLLTEARDARSREPSNVGHEQLGQMPLGGWGFDGGVRGSIIPQREENMNGLIARVRDPWKR